MKNQNVLTNAVCIALSLLVVACGASSSKLADDTATSQVKTIDLAPGNYVVDVRGDQPCPGNYKVEAPDTNGGRRLIISKTEAACNPETHVKGFASIEMQMYENAGALSFSETLSSGEKVSITVKKISKFDFIVNGGRVSELPATLEAGEYYLSMGTILPCGGDFKLIGERNVTTDSGITLKLSYSLTPTPQSECSEEMGELAAVGGSLILNEQSAIKLDVTNIHQMFFATLTKYTTKQVYPAN